MSRVSLSLKDARTIRDWFATDPGEGCPSSVTEAMGRLRDALQPSPKKAAAKKAKAATVRAKKAHRAETSEIYREVEG